MKRFIARILLLFAMLLSTALLSDAQNANQQMSRAVLKIYNEELQENPNNYNVLFRRAYHLYGLNRYQEALDDVDKALVYTPKKDTDLRSQEFQLRANILLQLGRTEEALPAISSACQADPSSYMLLYQKANVEYELGRYAEAKEDYRRLERIHNRSLESLIGLGRVAVREGDVAKANEYADRAVQLYPTDPDAYLRRASVRSMLGNNTGAVDDMIVALSLDNHSPRALKAMAAMADTDYEAVVSALTSAIAKAPNNGIYYYIRGMVAQNHYRFLQAVADYTTIIDRRLFTSPGVHASLAECYFALCRFTDAIDEINSAIGMTAANGQYFVTAAKIRLAEGKGRLALQAANAAVDRVPDSNQALMQRALAQVALEHYDDALASISEAVVNNPAEPTYLLLQGWILKDFLGRGADANASFDRLLALDSYPAADARSLRGFALQMLGRDADAAAWLDAVLAADPVDPDGRTNYLAACLYSHLGDNDRAFDCMRTSLSHGYADLEQWRVANVANISPAPLRSQPRFESLLSAFSHLFEAK